MALDPYLLTFNPARAAVDGRGVFTKEVADALTRLFAAYNGSIATINSMVTALEADSFLTASARAAASTDSLQVGTTGVSPAQIAAIRSRIESIRLDEIEPPIASVNFNVQQATSFRVENRTSDPGAPSAGQIWLRTDL